MTINTRDTNTKKVKLRIYKQTCAMTLYHLVLLQRSEYNNVVKPLAGVECI